MEDVANTSMIANMSADTTTQIIRLVQLPIIEEKLYPLKPQWEDEARFATELVVTEENLDAAKKRRSDMRKRYAELDELRKLIKEGISKPYTEFQEVFKECVETPCQIADEQYRAKIKAIEDEIKDSGKARVMDYFNELCVANHVEWLSFEQLNIKINKADATSKTQKALKEEIAQAVERVATGVDLIREMEWADEIMVEYRNCLQVNKALLVVKERHANLDKVQREQQEREEVIEQEKEAENKVNALLPPKEVEEPQKPVECPVQRTDLPDEKVVTLQFSVRATVSKLRILKAWLLENDYEIK